MERTKIFVSSTYFDLAQVREDIKITITGLGHEPLLNEYPSFPVLPGLDTIANCKRVVRGSDIFVLIIGGRRGSLDPTEGKSITNIEYETAVEGGLDCFVFIQEQIMTLLPVWRKNPSTDFTPMVDSSQVFEFIESISAKQRWVFSFTRASQISEILRIQLSVFLKSLLDRRRMGRLTPLQEFSLESQKARELVLDRPVFWEYLLTEELLRSKLTGIQRQYDDLRKGLLFRPKRYVNAKEYLSWMAVKLEEPVAIGRIVNIAIEKELPDAWGPPGSPGDPNEILRAVNQLAQACQALLNWEVDMVAITPPPVLQPLAATLQGVTKVLLDEIGRLPDELSKALEGTWTGSKTVKIKLTVPSPPQLENYKRELARVTANPEELYKVWE